VLILSSRHTSVTVLNLSGLGFPPATLGLELLCGAENSIGKTVRCVPDVLRFRSYRPICLQEFAGRALALGNFADKVTLIRSEQDVQVLLSQFIVMPGREIHCANCYKIPIALIDRLPAILSVKL